MKLYDVYPLFDINIVKGQGCKVWDDKGQEYLDLYGGHAVISIGHCHPQYVEMLTNQLNNLGFYSNSVINKLQVKLAERLGKISGYEDYQFFLINYKIYGLNKERVFITDDVVQMRCDICGSVYAVSAENAELWNGAPCQRSTCGGFLEKYKTGEINYYGRLYSAGDLVRINAREHTGLLERPNREQLETDFKRGKDTQELWDPNVLSCTPTLEMGIDIGDLSTVILCSMPPAQSQFLQRAGRAGQRPKIGRAHV